MGRKKKTQNKEQQLMKQRLERVELRLKLLKLSLEIPLVIAVLLVAISKLLQL